MGKNLGLKLTNNRKIGQFLMRFIRPILGEEMVSNWLKVVRWPRLKLSHCK